MALVNLTRRSARTQARPACRQPSASLSISPGTPRSLSNRLRDVFRPRVTGRDTCETFDRRGETPAAEVSRDSHHREEEPRKVTMTTRFYT